MPPPSLFSFSLQSSLPHALCSMRNKLLRIFRHARRYLKLPPFLLLRYPYPRATGPGAISIRDIGKSSCSARRLIFNGFKSRTNKIFGRPLRSGFRDRRQSSNQEENSTQQGS
ncbi:hypothetical protein BKA70DRAFT_1398895 [Coprinopsis sp. MPI-PUGE-AT-0042]|nr:hypothetical protein BKA70DRAFT_1398895 [Coprinopsis sp. MPI-PUGE-AT-0042]